MVNPTLYCNGCFSKLHPASGQTLANASLFPYVHFEKAGDGGGAEEQQQ
jgi:hypothetical protein